MAIPTSRTHSIGQVHFNDRLCDGCGLCAEVCKDFGIRIVEGKAGPAPSPIFGCIGCGHCMAICPRQAITVDGRCLSPADLSDLPDRRQTAGYDELLALLQRRRSIREFTEQAVAPVMIDRIVEAVRTAPMGLPPSDVHLLIFDSRERVRRLAVDFCTYLEGMRWLTADWFLILMRPFWGKASDRLFRDFVRPLVKAYTGAMERGQNLVTYDAPAAIYFYGSPYCDPADPVVAATYAMLAAESLGLATCMIGGMHPLIQHGRAARRFRKAQGIRHASREGLLLLVGHPRIAYRKGIRRSLAAVEYHGRATEMQSKTDTGNTLFR